MDNSVVRIALFSWLLASISCNTTSFTNVSVQDMMAGETYLCDVDVTCSTSVNMTVNTTIAIDTIYIIDGLASNEISQSGDNQNGSQSVCYVYQIENSTSNLTCNCSNLSCTQLNDTQTAEDTHVTMAVETTTQLLTSKSAPDGTTETTSTDQDSESTILSHSPPDQSSSSTPSSTESRSTTTGPLKPLALSPTMLVLWCLLGFLLLLILFVSVTILCVAASYCRRYKGKKRPTAMDIISKWEDTPEESSEIKLVSVKSIGDNDEDEEGEKKEKDGAATENEESDTKKDNSKDATKDDGEKKKGDITLGTFGFPEVVVEPTARKAETQADETDKKEESRGDEDGKSEKEDRKKDVVSDKSSTVVKSGDESATSKEEVKNSTSDKQSPSVTNVTAKKAATVELKQEENKLIPVPVHIPVFGKLEDKIKAPAAPSGQVEETSVKSDKTAVASPTKEGVLQTTDTSSTNKEVSITDKVSKETKTAATTKPESQTVDSKVVLVSDKLPADTGGLSLISNEDIEKALGVTIKGLDQDVSTQL